MSGQARKLHGVVPLWHGDLPTGWNARRFKHVAFVRGGQVDPRNPVYGQMPLFAPDHIESGTGRLHPAPSAEEQGAISGKYLVQAGDVLYSKIRPALRKVALAPTQGLCSADVYAIWPRTGVDARFLFYCMLGEGFYRYTLLESDRVAMPKINREALGECILALAAPGEQTAIASFLDRKTAAIDALIEKKERLIELLQEKRQALITQAVTKGLDPTVPMKDSGIQWLGEIPAHWEVLPIKRNSVVLDCKHRTVPFVDDGVPVVSIGEVHGLEVDLASAKRTPHHEYLQMIEGGRAPRVGDIIYSRNATVGEAAYVASDAPFCMGQDVSLIRSSAFCARFLLHQLRSPIVLRQLSAMTIGATFKRINVAQIKTLVVAAPPVVEQREIAAFCDAAYEHSNSILGKLDSQVARVREYRQALITAAVTGKIDVPEQAA